LVTAVKLTLRHRKPVVRFKSYYDLLQPPREWKPDYAFETYEVKPFFPPYRPTHGSAEQLLHIFEQRNASWLESTTFVRVQQFFNEYPMPENIDNIICFGLGELESRSYTKIVDRHIAAMTMANLLASRYGRRIRVLAQDPSYSMVSEQALQALGFEMVGRYGAAGFAEISDTSVVFTQSPGVKVREIVAEMPRPALFITDESDEPPPPPPHPSGRSVPR
jgi:hypothetical protein